MTTISKREDVFEGRISLESGVPVEVIGGAGLCLRAGAHAGLMYDLHPGQLRVGELHCGRQLSPHLAKVRVTGTTAGPGEGQATLSTLTAPHLSSEGASCGSPSVPGSL